MNIAFYAPFKPINHPNPSGDLVIANSLYQYFSMKNHDIWASSQFRSRWVYKNPLKLLYVLMEYKRASQKIARKKPDLWLTYHTYYKSPDLLGPGISQQAGVPYIIFQGIYSTKKKKKLKTLPGYLLNKKALCRAQHVFTNRQEDLVNLERLLPSNRLTYIAPGIYPDEMCFDPKARKEIRLSWGIGKTPVILTAAMFRSGVKTEGIAWVIRSCGRLFKQGVLFHLIIAGDGKEKNQLVQLAGEQLPEDRYRFVGKIPRNKMYKYYSASDIFTFPGIRESLGMVFLESQSCGLPVLAFDNGGIPEVVQKGNTGFLEPLFHSGPYDKALKNLITNEHLRKEMGKNAGCYVRKSHDLNRNYQKMENIILDIVSRKTLWQKSNLS